MVIDAVQIGSPMQSPGKHSTGKTHVSPPPAVQTVFDVQLLPPTEHVPVEHCADVVHENVLFAQWPPQFMSV